MLLAKPAGRGFQWPLSTLEHPRPFVLDGPRTTLWGPFPLGPADEASSKPISGKAILDRLLHLSTTINIRGQSYRLPEQRKAGVFRELAQSQKEG